MEGAAGLFKVVGGLKGMRSKITVESLRRFRRLELRSTLGRDRLLITRNCKVQSTSV